MATKKYKDLWICRDCEWVGSEFLEGVNPFDKDDTVVGCPGCKSVDTLVAACCIPGCGKASTSGTPTKDGYMRTCHEHSPRDDKKAKGKG